jgi:hypothetical protein
MPAGGGGFALCGGLQGASGCVWQAAGPGRSYAHETAEVPMKLKQIVVSIENSPGRLLEVTEALGKAGINLRALNLVDTGAFGQLRLLVSDVVKARRILMEMQIPAYVNDVVAAEIEDKPGSLAMVLAPLHGAGVNVVFMYAFIGFSQGKAVMIFRFSDNDRAVEILKANGVSLVDAETFGILETGS